MKEITPLLDTLKGRKISALVIGTSAGGVEALSTLLPELSSRTGFAVICVLHLPAQSPNLLPELLATRCRIPIKEAESTEPIEAGRIYIAPPGYHLSVESDRSFSLSTEEPVHFARPSIDILFESAADVYRHEVAAILLTGANDDGAEGLKKIQELGGLTLVQDPASALSPTMPQAALKLISPDGLLDLVAMAELLRGLTL